LLETLKKNGKNTVDLDYQHLLEQAAEFKNLEAVQKLLEELEKDGENIVDLILKDNKSLLEHAICKNGTVVVEYFLKILEEYGHDIVKIILEKNADNKSLLHHAISQKSPVLCNFLLTKLKEKDEKALCKFLLQIDKEGKRPLHYAIDACYEMRIDFSSWCGTPEILSLMINILKGDEDFLSRTKLLVGKELYTYVITARDLSEPTNSRKFVEIFKLLSEHKLIDNRIQRKEANIAKVFKAIIEGACDLDASIERLNFFINNFWRDEIFDNMDEIVKIIFDECFGGTLDFEQNVNRFITMIKVFMHADLLSYTRLIKALPENISDGARKLRQGELLKYYRQYLELFKRDPKFISTLNEGHCHGLALVRSIAHLFDVRFKGQSNIDNSNWFFRTLLSLSIWGELDKEFNVAPTLEQQDDFERLLSHVVLFQDLQQSENERIGRRVGDPADAFNMLINHNNESDSSDNDPSEKMQLYKGPGFAFTMHKDEVIITLNAYLEHMSEKTFLSLGSHNHAICIFKSKDKYVFFDSNTQDRSVSKVEELPDLIWRSFGFKQKQESPLSIMSFGYNKAEIETLKKELKKAKLLDAFNAERLNKCYEDTDGMTALGMSVSRKNSDFVKELLRRGADPELGVTMKLEGKARFLVPKKLQKLSILTLAVAQEDLASTSALLKNAANIDLYSLFCMFYCLKISEHGDKRYQADIREGMEEYLDPNFVAGLIIAGINDKDEDMDLNRLGSIYARMQTAKNSIYYRFGSHSAWHRVIKAIRDKALDIAKKYKADKQPITPVQKAIFDTIFGRKSGRFSLSIFTAGQSLSLPTFDRLKLRVVEEGESSSSQPFKLSVVEEEESSSSHCISTLGA